MKNENKLTRCDFHCHPLSHKYYPASDYNKNIVLTEEDKEDIRDYIHWCIHVRKLDVTAITDHDLIQSSLYAREYVKQNNLPIKIICGAECEVFIRDDEYLEIGKYKFREWNYCHMLVLGVDHIPEHKSNMTELEFKAWADKIRSIGGIVVMSHPLFSKLVFYIIAEHLDGFESINRDVLEFGEGIEYSDKEKLNLKAFTNSDYHWYNDDRTEKSIPINVNYESSDFINGLVW